MNSTENTCTREFMEIFSPEEVRQEYAAILEKMLGQHR